MKLFQFYSERYTNVVQDLCRKYEVTTPHALNPIIKSPRMQWEILSQTDGNPTIESIEECLEKSGGVLLTTAPSP